MRVFHRQIMEREASQLKLIFGFSTNSRMEPFTVEALTERKAQSKLLKALRQKMKATRRLDPNAEELKLFDTRYSILAAQYKCSSLSSKNAAWGKFCSSESSPFGTSHKFSTGKYWKKWKFHLKIPNEIKVEFTKAELRTALNSFNDKKTPGPDAIDFRLLKRMIKILLQRLTG